jgi:hypothetical protein
MARTVFAMITLLDDGGGAIDPGYGRPGGGPRPDQGLPIYHPGHPDHGLPSAPAHPSQPIYHPGHPDHGLPAHPDQGLPGGGGGTAGQLPWSPTSPDHSLPVPPGITPPQVPANLKDKLVVLWRLPNTTEWHGKAVAPGTGPDQGLPEAPEPKA